MALLTLTNPKDPGAGSLYQTIFSADIIRAGADIITIHAALAGGAQQKPDLEHSLIGAPFNLDARL